MIRVHRSPPSGSIQELLSLLSAELDNPSVDVAEHWAASRRKLQPAAEELGASFHRKCAWCESLPESVSFANIDHFRPKTAFRSLTYAWDNWIFSCQRCNTYKGARWSETLLSPTADEVETHVTFIGSVVQAISERGVETIAAVRIDRPELDPARRSQLTLVHSILAHLRQPEGMGPALVDTFTDFAMAALGDDAPFAGAARCMFGSQPLGQWPPYQQSVAALFDALASMS